MNSVGRLVEVGITYMEGRGILQDLIPDVVELEPAKVPFEEWIIDPYEHGFLDDLDRAVCLPTHHIKLFPLVSIFVPQ